MFDYQLQSVQQYFAHVSAKEFVRRSWILKNNLGIKIEKENDLIKWNHSRVIERIKIREIIIKHGLDQDVITVSSEQNNQDPYDTDIHFDTNFDFDVDFGIQKPVVLCSNKEIRQYVRKKLPIVKNPSTEDAYINSIDQRTMSKQIKSARRRGLAIIAHELFYIGGKTKNARVTPAQRYERKITNEKNQEWMNNTEVHGKNGTIHKLKEVGVTAEKRIAEMSCASDGLQEYCEKLGWVWASCVVTLEPHFHPNPTTGKSGWDGTLPDQALRVLMKRWSIARAMLSNKKIKFAGFRTVESHKDGCPHVNFLIYFDESNKKKVESIFNSAFGKTSKLCRFVHGRSGDDSAKFSTYATKYFKKYIKDNDELDNACLEEQAWSSAWGIRRFQWFGIPSLEVWRNLRSCAIKPRNKLLAEVWQAARDKDFNCYIELQGGLNIEDKKRKFRTIKATSTTGRSYINVGVYSTTTKEKYITKEVGFWTLKTARISKKSLSVSEYSHFFKSPEILKNTSLFNPPVATKNVATVATCITVLNKNDAVTVISSYPSKVKIENQNLEKQKFDDSRLRKPPLIPIERLKNNTEKVSNRQAAVADIVKRRSIHPGYRYRMTMINADLADLGLSPLTIFDNVH